METDKHHIWWREKDYHSALEQRFRAFGGFVIAMNQINHRHLHGDLPPPPKPSHNLMHNILQVVHSDYTDGSLEAIYQTIDYLYSQRGTEPQRIAEHLIAQVGYMTL